MFPNAASNFASNPVPFVVVVGDVAAGIFISPFENSFQLNQKVGQQGTLFIRGTGLTKTHTRTITFPILSHCFDQEIQLK